MKSLAVSAPPGPFVEVGVFHGGSAEILYDIAQKQNRELHLFDTFKGLPNYTEGVDKHKVGEFADENAPEKIRELMPLARLYIGAYPETHPNELKEVAFIHCDCDQYLSYRAVIDTMWPLVTIGGFLLFDDYPYLGGAKKAVEESFAIEKLKKCGSHFYAVKENGLG